MASSCISSMLLLIAFPSLINAQITSNNEQLSPLDCGNIIINCQSDNIFECCHGPCCSLLSKYKERTIQPPQQPRIFTYANPPNNNPDKVQMFLPPVRHINGSKCNDIGEECNSMYEPKDRCCNGATLFEGGTRTCKFSGDKFDSLGNQIGVCCVKNRKSGCTKDSDCCRDDGICSGGICVRDTNLYYLDGIKMNNMAYKEFLGNPSFDTVAAKSARVSPQETMKSLGDDDIPVDPVGIEEDDEDDKDDEGIELNMDGGIDWRESEEYKRRNDLWLKISLGLVIFIAFFIFVSVILYLKYTNHCERRRRMSMDIVMDGTLECNISNSETETSESDGTAIFNNDSDYDDFDEYHDNVIHSTGNIVIS